ncbi:MAG: right-handed parallel beta-helix repeat-containing protein [Bacteroidetes bacterium]|nr:right-handed parallel beta-helix repeat-containing protein [Bacteroidota bacterium]
MNKNNRFYLYITIIGLITFFAINPAFAINYVNVQDYGAVGNGTTDDTSSIQTALNTGNPIYFPKTSSYYKVSSALTYSGSRIVSNGATIKATNTTFILLTISGASGLYVGDLTLEYSTEQELTNGNSPLKVIYSSDFIIERVIGKKGGAIYIVNSENGVVRDCQMLGSSYNAFYVRSSTGIVVENCYAEKSFSAFAVENSTYVEFLNNTAYDCNLGLRIEDSAHVQAEENFFRYCMSGAVAYGPQSGSTLYTTDIIFRGNTFYHCYKNVTVDKDEAYANNVCEFTLSSKMRVGDVIFDNNIVIGNDESTLLTDLSSNVIFNTSIGLTTAQVSEDTSGTSYHTMVPYAKYVHINKTGGVPINWLFYVNFPSGVDISEEDVLTMDVCWLSGTGMDEETMAVNLYSEENCSSGLINDDPIPLYNPYDYIAMPTILRIPDNVDVSSVKSIEVIRVGGPVGAGFTVSEIRKGLQSKIGYYHSYYHSEPSDGVQNAVLDSNVFVDIDYSYVDRKRRVAYEMTVITGTGMIGTTAQRPSSPEIGWRYYDTDLDTTVYWDGNNWFDISTYLMGGKVNKAVHFDGDNFVNLGNNESTDLNHYTIESWIKPTDSNVADRRIMERYDISDPNGWLLMLWTNNILHGYQSVGGNFYAVMVGEDFPHDGEFHHVAMTFDYDGTTSTLKLYIDGELVDTSSAIGAPDYADEAIDLKCGYNFEGIIDEIKYYKKSLKAKEIEKEFHKEGELFASPSLLTVGTGGDYSTLTAALNDVSIYDTIQFIDDNQTHTFTSQLALTDSKYEGLTITSLL